MQSWLLEEPLSFIHSVFQKPLSRSINKEIIIMIMLNKRYTANSFIIFIVKKRSSEGVYL